MTEPRFVDLPEERYPPRSCCCCGKLLEERGPVASRNHEAPPGAVWLCPGVAHRECAQDYYARIERPSSW